MVTNKGGGRMGKRKGDSFGNWNSNLSNSMVKENFVKGSKIFWTEWTLKRWKHKK